MHNNQKDEFLITLKNSSDKFLPEIDYAYASILYYVEFRSLYDDKDTNLDLDDYIHGIKVLNAIVGVNKSIDYSINKSSGSNNEYNKILIEALLNTSAHLKDINVNLIDYYKDLFYKLKLHKLNNINDENNNSNINESKNIDEINTLLTHSEIQESIYQANVQYEKEYLGIN